MSHLQAGPWEQTNHFHQHLPPTFLESGHIFPRISCAAWIFHFIAIRNCHYWRLQYTRRHRLHKFCIFFRFPAYSLCAFTACSFPYSRWRSHPRSHCQSFRLDSGSRHLTSRSWSFGPWSNIFQIQFSCSKTCHQNSHSLSSLERSWHSGFQKCHLDISSLHKPSGQCFWTCNASDINTDWHPWQPNSDQVQTDCPAITKATDKPRHTQIQAWTQSTRTTLEAIQAPLGPSSLSLSMQCGQKTDFSRLSFKLSLGKFFQSSISMEDTEFNTASESTWCTSKQSRYHLSDKCISQLFQR